MLKVTIEMRCSGSAFGEYRGDRLREAARILAGLARELGESADAGPEITGQVDLFDQNGNHVGEFRTEGRSRGE